MCTHIYIYIHILCTCISLSIYIYRERDIYVYGVPIRRGPIRSGTRPYARLLACVCSALAKGVLRPTGT